MGPKKLLCPRCNSLLVARAKSTGPSDRQPADSGLQAFECRSCGHRFQAAPPEAPPPAETQDRRKHTRVPIKMPVDLEWGEHGGEGTITDISKGGCAVESPHARALTTGQLLRLKFPPPTGSVDLLGTQKIATVQNLRGEKAGMKFLAPTDEDQVKLTKTVSKSIQFFPPKP